MKKLDDKWTGPFEIVETYKQACKLALHPRIKIYPLFHYRLLRAVEGEGFIRWEELENLREFDRDQQTILERDDREIKS